MENNSSFQNGQESKEVYIADDSQLVNSIGREEEFYSSIQNIIKNSYTHEFNCNQNASSVDNKDELSVNVENGSISGTIGDGFTSALQKEVAEFTLPGKARRSDLQNSESKINSKKAESMRISNSINRSKDIFEFADGKDNLDNVPKEKTNSPLNNKLNIKYSRYNTFDNCSNNGAYTTPQKSKISKNFILAQTENNLQSQTLDCAAFANLGNLVNNKHALFERESKDYLLVEGSEEKKTEMCLNSDFMHFNVSPMYQAEKRNSKLKKKADKSSNMLSYLFDIEEILYPKMLKPECKEDREDNNIEDLRVDTPKLISLRSDKNLISVNNSKNSMSFTSKCEVSQSESTTRRPEDCIEEKEGWILKRSFNHPNSIGWQK